MNRYTLVEVVAFTRPDVFYPNSDRGEPYDYQRIVALWQTDGVFDRYVGEKDPQDADIRRLVVPRYLGSRLLDGMRRVEANKPVNCHYMACLLAGLDTTGNAPFVSEEGMPINGPLAVGELGVVSNSNCYPHHSVIGLGEDVPESIQVMSSFGEFGIADNEAILNFYNQIHPGNPHTLYAKSGQHIPFVELLR